MKVPPQRANPWPCRPSVVAAAVQVSSIGRDSDSTPSIASLRVQQRRHWCQAIRSRSPGPTMTRSPAGRRRLGAGAASPPAGAAVRTVRPRTFVHIYSGGCSGSRVCTRDAGCRRAATSARPGRPRGLARQDRRHQPAYGQHTACDRRPAWRHHGVRPQHGLQSLRQRIDGEQAQRKAPTSPCRRTCPTFRLATRRGTSECSASPNFRPCSLAPRGPSAAAQHITARIRIPFPPVNPRSTPGRRPEGAPESGSADRTPSLSIRGSRRDTFAA